MDPGLYYPEEMGRPEVARIRAHYAGLDTRALHDASRDRFRQTGGSFYHGDTWAPTFFRLLHWAGLTASDVFYDLGCGCGEPTLTAALLTPQAHGLDLLPGLVRVAEVSARSLELGATFAVADMLEADIRSGTFFYVAATTFDRWHRQQLVRR
ncbi:MAG: class I SAM-dependent methyltransferase, partial [Candidatus Eremiobacteraeota bacterium]|nr:class I SAM-dependent methyltransferase [Candidatus Eremiobacteraeota bacterium]